MRCKTLGYKVSTLSVIHIMTTCVTSVKQANMSPFSQWYKFFNQHLLGTVLYSKLDNVTHSHNLPHIFARQYECIFFKIISCRSCMWFSNRILRKKNKSHISCQKCRIHRSCHLIYDKCFNKRVDAC